MTNTLTTLNDVAEFAEADSNFSGCKLRDIRQVEMHEFRCRMGLEFMSELISDLADYEDEPEWDKLEAGYVVNDIVYFYDLYWKANQSVPVGEQPSHMSDHWDLAPKFTTECYETLWCTYLGYYLVNTILLHKSIMVSTPMKDAGFIKNTGSAFVPANPEEIGDAATNMSYMTKMAYGNMKQFIKDNKETCTGLELFEKGFCGSCDSTDCSCDNDDCAITNRDYIWV